MPLLKPTKKELSTALQIVEDHRKHLLRRLTTRSPLLRFQPSARRLDVKALFENILGNVPMLPNAHIARNNPVSTPEQLLTGLLDEPYAATVNSPLPKATAKCTAMRAQAEDYRHTTGQHALYLGYPLVYIPLETGKFILAPILLWALEILPPSSNRIRVKRVIEDGGVPVPPKINPILSTWLLEEKNVKITSVGDSEIVLGKLGANIKKIFREWRELNQTCVIDSIDAVPASSTLKEWSTRGTDPKILPSAVIGLAPFKGEAILRDLERIAAEIRKGNANLGILGKFIFASQSGQHSSLSTPDESQQWLVTSADHSQEDAIWQTRDNDLTVLHGPPGTGKSQTIVNLIADAVARKKTVLVVCQKEAALEVVKKRLVAAGLGDLVLKVDDLHTQRQQVIKAIRDVGENFTDSLCGAGEREKIIKNLGKYEHQINGVTDALNETDSQSRLRYCDLRARMHSREIDSVRSQSRNFAYDQCPRTLRELENLGNEIDQFCSDYNESHYIENPWRFIVNGEVLTAPLIEDLREWLEEVSQLANDVDAVGLRQFHPERLSWLAEHNWINGWYSAFLKEDLRGPEERFILLMRKISAIGTWFSRQAVDAIREAVRRDVLKCEIISSYQKYLGTIRTVAMIRNKLQSKTPYQQLHLHCNEVHLWKSLVMSSTYRQWLKEWEENHPHIRSAEVSKWISKLRIAVDKKRQMDQSYVKMVFAERIEPRNKLQDLDLLRLRGRGETKHTSLRKLYHNGFRPLHKLYPVLMTNPDVAAALLDFKAGLYDLLIIDEASQVFMADVMPSLLRAEAVIVSGDQWQMPPSDFFALGDGSVDADADDDDEVEEEDLEEANADQNRLIPAQGEYCLLDAAMHAVRAGTTNNVHLQVHYRSDARELIDFSNHAFYDGKLLIPPGNALLPSFLNCPIRLQCVNGTFHRGVNEVEASEVVRFLRDEIWTLDNRPSVGIVTFNIKQRDAIEDLLADEAMRNETFREVQEYERNRVEDGEDVGLFVRSVEHVQGDERDIIIFSTTYDSKRTKNFGPISKKDKGRRRLNVAVTRAKRGIVIISSLDFDKISSDAEREQYERYWFWKYLCYARAVAQKRLDERNLILRSLCDPQPGIRNASVADSEFEVEVADFLRAKGFAVDYQVGESGFRIDLGIRKTADDGRYLCGVECDGRRYHSKWTARMNDVWRQGILESKGWKIIRVWSSDWYDNPEDTKVALIERIGAAE